MINGVLMIVAAVLFAIQYLLEGLSIMWLWVSGFYLVVGILNLIFHVVKEKAKVRSANKKAAKSAQEAEEAQKKNAEPKKEEKV